MKTPIEISPVSQFLSQSQPRKKAAKGTVAVQVFKDRLRLCWSYLGKRYYLYVGLPDSKVNRTVAEAKARIIEGDLATGNFDPTLRKYKPESQQKANHISVVALFEQFTAEKTKSLYARTLQKYKAILGLLKKHFDDKAACTITVLDAETFAAWLSTQRLSPRSRQEYLALLKAAWEWGLKNDLAVANPWIELPGRIKVPPKQMPKPFTREEIGAIIQAFRTDCYYSPYADYVEFLFGTGCRTGEAIGLKWKHVSDDCSTVWIGESLSRGERKSTKTNRARTVGLSLKLQAMLLARRPNGFDPEALVFPSPKGGAIDDNNFRNRAWKNILTRLEIDYRKPYITRHTMISHALDQGMNPVNVAQLTGHDVQVLYRNYAGNVNSRLILPDL